MLNMYLTLFDIKGFIKRSLKNNSVIFIEDHDMFIFRGKVYRKAPS